MVVKLSILLQWHNGRYKNTYRQAPYQDCSKQEYENLLKSMPDDIDWLRLSEYEETDMTAGSQELACSADGGCEIVDLTSVA